MSANDRIDDAFTVALLAEMKRRNLSITTARYAEAAECFRSGYLAALAEAAKVAEEMAWTNKNTASLGPEQNCMAVARAIERIGGREETTT